MKKIIIKNIYTLFSLLVVPSAIISCSTNKSNQNDDINEEIKKIQQEIESKSKFKIENENEITKDFINKNLIEEINIKYPNFTIVLMEFTVEFQEKKVTLKLSITNKENPSITKVFDTYIQYQINLPIHFKEQNQFDFGDPNFYTLNDQITNNYLKNKIISNRNMVFDISNNFLNVENFLQSNLIISKVKKNNGDGYITFNATISNLENKNSISQNIVFNNFKKYDENLISLPPIKTENYPTKEEFDNEVKYWEKYDDLALSQFYFTNEEIDALKPKTDVTDLLIDIRTNQVPINFTDLNGADKRGFDYNAFIKNIDKTNNLIECSIVISDYNGNYGAVEIIKNFPFEIYQPNLELVNKILEKVKIFSINDDYKNIRAKEFSNYDIMQIKKFFNYNEEEIFKTFWNEPGFEKYLVTFVAPKDAYNFKKPEELKFEIHVDNQRLSQFKKKDQIVFGFKPFDSIGILDKAPMKDLITPQGCTSYKGELERFLLTDFNITTENEYKSQLNKVTWEDVKKEFMHQIRFYLYQMFGDNYSEINYYIKNEQNGTRFIAVGEGIIKENKKNVFFGFLPNIGTDGYNATCDVYRGDKIKIEIPFETSKNSSFKPTFIDRGDIFGDFTNSWWWNFKDNCNNLKNIADKLYVSDIPRNNWSGASGQYSFVSINGTKRINAKNNQYNSFWFSKLYKIPK